MEIVTGGSSFSREARREDEGRVAASNAILWAAVIAVLLGLNFASWSFCLWVFGQPEHPFNYKLLTRLEKLEPVTGFTPVSAPRGRFRSAKDLYATVYPFEATELRAYNGMLKRRYLRNYAERSDATFLAGEFEVESARPLKLEDAFPSGWVVRGRSTEFPDAGIDLVLPSPDPPQDFALAPGSVLTVAQSTMCAAVLNVERRPDGTMVFTAVPLVARDYEFGDGAAIAVSPPGRIRVEAGRWPVSREGDGFPSRPVELASGAGEGEAPEAEAAEGGGNGRDGEGSE